MEHHKHSGRKMKCNFRPNRAMDVELCDSQTSSAMDDAHDLKTSSIKSTYLRTKSRGSSQFNSDNTNTTRHGKHCRIRETDQSLSTPSHTN